MCFSVGIVFHFLVIELFLEPEHLAILDVGGIVYILLAQVNIIT